jgi:hypothetical protein
MKQLLDWFISRFKAMSVEDIARREYENARRSLLQCQSMQEYYENMVRFETQRIERLSKMLNLDRE